LKEQISQRLQENIGRVKNLVGIYHTHLQGSGSGRRGHLETDVLRAATVFLHATLEDFLRSLSYWKLPVAKKDVIDKIPLVGSKGNASKFFLGELVAHKGKSVDTLIKESVDQYLEKSNYNNIEEIKFLLASIGVDSAKINNEIDALIDIMNRRHQIVHRADIDNTGGQGNHRVKSISVTVVNKWIESVEIFGSI
jgi:hypothetical protein